MINRAEMINWAPAKHAKHGNAKHPFLVGKTAFWQDIRYRPFWWEKWHFGRTFVTGPGCCIEITAEIGRRRRAWNLRRLLWDLRVLEGLLSLAILMADQRRQFFKVVPVSFHSDNTCNQLAASVLPVNEG